MSLEVFAVNLTNLNRQYHPYFIMNELEEQLSDIKFKYRREGEDEPTIFSKAFLSDKIEIEKLNKKIEYHRKNISEYYTIFRDLCLSKFSLALSQNKDDEYILNIFTAGNPISGVGTGKTFNFSKSTLLNNNYYPRKLSGYYFSNDLRYNEVYPIVIFRDLLKVCTKGSFEHDENNQNYNPSSIELQALDWLDNFFIKITPIVQNILDNLINGEDFNEEKERVLKIHDHFLKSKTKYTIMKKEFKIYLSELEYIKQKQDREINPGKTRLDIIDQFITRVEKKERPSS